MNARKFLDTFGTEEGERIAKASGTTLAYLRQIAGGHRACSPSLALKLQRESGKRIRAKALRPDIFGDAL